jgi:hypothetical protein
MPDFSLVFAISFVQADPDGAIDVEPGKVLPSDIGAQHLRAEGENKQAKA